MNRRLWYIVATIGVACVVSVAVIMATWSGGDSLQGENPQNTQQLTSTKLDEVPETPILQPEETVLIGEGEQELPEETQQIVQETWTPMEPVAISKPEQMPEQEVTEIPVSKPEEIPDVEEEPAQIQTELEAPTETLEQSQEGTEVPELIPIPTMNPNLELPNVPPRPTEPIEIVPIPELTQEPIPTSTPDLTPHEHDFVQTSVDYTYKRNGIHIVKITYSCISCDYSYVDTKEEECEYSKWVEISGNKKTRECKLCGHLEIHRITTPEPWEPNVPVMPEPHIHEFVQTAVHYTSKEDGTHIAEITYSCRSGDASYTSQNEEICVYGDWQADGEFKEVRECQLCKHLETRVIETPTQAPIPTETPHVHEFVETAVHYTSNEDGTHIAEVTYSCISGDESYEDTKTEACDYGEWEYVGNSEEAQSCRLCGYSKTREHEHEAPENLENLQYAFDSSNENGTHRLQAIYVCSGCKESVELYKDEECDYEFTGYERTGVNDIHLEVKTCKICQYADKQEGTCIPTGELQYVRVYAQIYEYYDCELCGDWCKRRYHICNQNAEPWEYYDEWEHSRYCVCGSGRQAEEHDWQYQDFGEDAPMDMLYCNVCNWGEPTAKHGHGEGLSDNMDLLELVKHPTYQADKIYNVTQTQIYNLYPDENTYCYRYKLLCSFCKKYYYVNYSHSFNEDEVCTRPRCGLSTPQIEDEDLTIEDVQGKTNILEGESLRETTNLGKNQSMILPSKAFFKE